MKKDPQAVSSRCWFTPDFQFGMHHFRYFADDFNCLPHTHGEHNFIFSLNHGFECIVNGQEERMEPGDLLVINKDSIAPRFNFAWSPFTDQKTIIQGGFDVFYTNSIAAINAPGQSSNNMPGWALSYAWQGSFYPDQCLPFSGQCVAFPLSDTTTDKAQLTTPPFTTEFAAQRRDPLLGFSHVEFFTPPPHDPMVLSWNLEVQRELPAKMMLSVGYVGTHGTHLMGEPFRQFNYVHTAAGSNTAPRWMPTSPSPMSIRGRLPRCSSKSTEVQIYRVVYC